jgi:ribose transport system ATP-binding protein
MLVCQNISKSYPGVKSLDGVSLNVAAGEVHALMGENGAGKSTLVRIIAGAAHPDGGSLVFDGREVSWSSARSARQAGLHVIHQELVLFGDMTVAENIFAGEEPRTRFGTIDHATMRRRSAEILRDLGAEIDIDREVGALTIADQQMVEIAKAFIGPVKLLILDEPTAVISGREAALLFDRLRRLKAQGVAIIYISHRLEEVFELADQATVLKDGKLVGSVRMADIDRDGLIRMMVGRELQDLYPPKPAEPSNGRTMLEVRGASDGGRLKSADLTLAAGEVLGIAGMVGSGRTELAEVIFGATALKAGSIVVDGEAVSKPTPKEQIARGIGFLTEDRKGEGLLLSLSVAVNISVPLLDDMSKAGFVPIAEERARARAEIASLKIAGAAPERPVVNLSGGNQQKVLFARWMAKSDKVLILDEPTRGVDVGAKAEIYRLIRQCAERGIGILVISSELPEIIGLCDRVLVMRAGETCGELRGEAITEEAILGLATTH